jgi:hypothetical protein
MTTAESLWVVIITMNIASMRDQVFERHDIEEYVLHFYVTWNVLLSATVYSARFNDQDGFHELFWGAFTVALLFLTSCLYHSMRGYATFAAALHLIICTGYARVALLLPRARVYGTYMALSAAVLAALYFALYLCDVENGTCERRLLWVAAAFEPLCMSVWKIGVALCGARRKHDVPGVFAYTVARVEGTHNMMLVVSFLFPLGLQGTGA